jgi:tetratricopeptide (TPR) repeat protein
MLLGSGAGWVWRDRTARAAEQANHLERAVDRAELLQREGKHGEALAALERAQLLGGEFEPPPPLRKRIDSVQGLLEAERQDLDFVARIEAILREEQTEVRMQKHGFSTENGNPKLRAALKQYGIEVAVTTPADAVARIQASRPAVQKHVVTALDESLHFLPSGDVRSRQWFLEVLQEVDSDPWRREARKAWLLNPQNTAARSKWAGYWYDLGVIHSDLTQYPKAIRDFSKAAEIKPEMAIAWHSLDQLRLHAGNWEEHRKLCAELLARFGKSDNVDILGYVTWSCVLAPVSVPDFQTVLEIAARLAKECPASKMNRLLHGAALYRSGQWKAAIEEVHQSQQARVRDLVWPAQESFLAMAYMQLGQVQDARRWLDAVVQWEQENQGSAWWARVLTEILRREAEALIKQGSDGMSPTKTAEK